MASEARFKARRVRELVKELGAEGGLIKSMELLAEDHNMIIQQVGELTAVCNKLIDVVSSLTDAATVLKDKVQRMSRAVDEGEQFTEEDIS